MKKREFFKRLLGITAAAVVAPKVLLAEEEPKKVIVGDSTFRWWWSHKVGDRMIGVDCVEEVISCNGETAEVYCKTPFLMAGSIISIERDGVNIDGRYLVIRLLRLSEEEMYRVSIRQTSHRDIDVRKGDFLVVKYNAYAEK